MTATYDAKNRALTLQDALGNVVSFGYDSVGNRTVQIDPLGNRTTWTYNVSDNAGGGAGPVGQRDDERLRCAEPADVGSDAMGNRGRGCTTADRPSGGAGRPWTELQHAGLRWLRACGGLGQPLGNRATTVYDLRAGRGRRIDALRERHDDGVRREGPGGATQDALGNLNTRSTTRRAA